MNVGMSGDCTPCTQITIEMIQPITSTRIEVRATDIMIANMRPFRLHSDTNSRNAFAMKTKISKMIVIVERRQRHIQRNKRQFLYLLKREMRNE